MWPTNTTEEDDCGRPYKSEPDSLTRSLVFVTAQVTSGFIDAKLILNFFFTRVKPFRTINDLISGTNRETGYTNRAPSALTDDDEGVVDVNATKAVGSFADVGACVICLHLLDLQAHAEDTETDPAAVNVAPIFLSLIHI